MRAKPQTRLRSAFAQSRDGLLFRIPFPHKRSDEKRWCLAVSPLALPLLPSRFMLPIDPVLLRISPRRSLFVSFPCRFDLLQVVSVPQSARVGDEFEAEQLTPLNGIIFFAFGVVDRAVNPLAHDGESALRNVNAVPHAVIQYRSVKHSSVRETNEKMEVQAAANLQEIHKLNTFFGGVLATVHEKFVTRNHAPARTLATVREKIGDRKVSVIHPESFRVESAGELEHDGTLSASGFARK